MKKFLIYIFTVFVFASCTKSMDEMYFNYVPNTISGEKHTDYGENPFIDASQTPTSTFSIDADGGSYTNARRMLDANYMPPPEAIRVEEFINYFQYDYPEPVGNDPISIVTEVGECPWTSGNKLMQIGIKGKTIQNLPASNLVFLIDVSGSMSDDDKLPLVQHGFKLLVDQLTANDRVAIVTYAGADKLVLKSTAGNEKDKINKAIDKLISGGGTAGAQGINTAYEIAVENFIEGGNNRVILASDGDFNIGISSTDDLIDMIEEKRDEGIFFTVLGVGSGNYNDEMMEQIANHGNGTYEYIDNKAQAKKVFVDEFGKFFTVAKDVKIQIIFDSTIVDKYRLIGYENRVLDSADFNNDKKDAGEIGSGQTITAIYEIVPKQNILRGNKPFDVDFRYKLPDQDVSIPMTVSAKDDFTSFDQTSENFRFAASVTAFGMQLKKSNYKGSVDYDKILSWGNNAKTYDPNGYRNDYINLVIKAKQLDK